VGSICIAPSHSGTKAEKAIAAYPGNLFVSSSARRPYFIIISKLLSYLLVGFVNYTTLPLYFTTSNFIFAGDQVQISLFCSLVVPTIFQLWYCSCHARQMISSIGCTSCAVLGSSNRPKDTDTLSELHGTLSQVCAVRIKAL
jgi:hypothetical protein